MSLAIDSQEASNVAHHSTTSPLSWSFTNTAGTLLVVGVVVAQASSAATPAVTCSYGGTAMTLGASSVGWNTADGNVNGLYLYYLTNPATGANTVSVTATNQVDIIAGAISFTGASSTPFGTAVSAANLTGSSTEASVSVSSTTSGDYIISLSGTGTSFSSATAPTTISALLNVSASYSSDNFALGQQSTSGGAVTASFAISADYWGILAVEIFAGAQHVQSLSTTASEGVSLSRKSGKLLSDVETESASFARQTAKTLLIGGSNQVDACGRATVSATTGKYYWEAIVDQQSGVEACQPGFASSTFSVTSTLGSSFSNGHADSLRVHSAHGIEFGGAFQNDGTYSVGDRLAFAVDIGNQLFWWQDLTTASGWHPSGSPGVSGVFSFAGFTGALYPAYMVHSNADSLTAYFNSADLTGALPAGFATWSSSPITEFWARGDHAPGITLSGPSSATATMTGGETTFASLNFGFLYAIFAVVASSSAASLLLRLRLSRILSVAETTSASATRAIIKLFIGAASSIGSLAQIYALLLPAAKITLGLRSLFTMTEETSVVMSDTEEQPGATTYTSELSNPTSYTAE